MNEQGTSYHTTEAQCTTIRTEVPLIYTSAGNECMLCGSDDLGDE